MLEATKMVAPYYRHPSFKRGKQLRDAIAVIEQWRRGDDLLLNRALLMRLTN